MSTTSDEYERCTLNRGNGRALYTHECQEVASWDARLARLGCSRKMYDITSAAPRHERTTTSLKNTSLTYSSPILHYEKITDLFANGISYGVTLGTVSDQHS